MEYASIDYTYYPGDIDGDESECEIRCNSCHNKYLKEGSFPK